MAQGDGMYLSVPHAVYCSRKLTPNAKLVYGLMLSLSKKEGYCFASHERIADSLGVSRDTVLVAIRQLQDLRCIKPRLDVVKRGGYKGGITECWECVHRIPKGKPKLISMPKKAAAM